MPLDRFAHFRAAEESIEWSKDAVMELGQLTDKALGSHNHQLFDEHDEITGETITKFRFMNPVPAIVRRRATEALVHARHGFDQAIFAAHEALSPGINYTKNFPWADNAKDLQRRFDAKGINQELWDFFSKYAPYPQRDKDMKLTRTLATIANNKHSVGYNIAGAVRAAMYPPILPVATTKMIDVQGGVWDHERQEIELYRSIGPVDQKGPIRVVLSLEITDSRLPAPIGAQYALGHFMSEARKLTAALKQECHRILGE